MIYYNVNDRCCVWERSRRPFSASTHCLQDSSECLVHSYHQGSAWQILAPGTWQFTGWLLPVWIRLASGQTVNIASKVFLYNCCCILLFFPFCIKIYAVIHLAVLRVGHIENVWAVLVGAILVYGYGPFWYTLFWISLRVSYFTPALTILQPWTNALPDRKM